MDNDLLAKAKEIQRRKLLEKAQAIQTQKLAEQGIVKDPIWKIEAPNPDYAQKLHEGAIESLPIAGAAIGGTLGSLPGAFVGGAGGAGLQKIIRGLQEQGPSYLTNKPTAQGVTNAATQVVGGGIGGVAGELTGNMASKLLSLAKPYIKSGIAKGAELTTGIPKEAYSRLIDYPKEVLKRYGPKESLDIGRKAQAELEIRNAIENNDIQKARQIFAENFGPQQINTKSILESRKKLNAPSLPNAEGVGAMTPNEAGVLSELERKGLTTKEVTYPPLKQPNVIGSTPIMGKRITQTKIMGPEFKGMKQVPKEMPVDEVYSTLKTPASNLPAKNIAEWSPEKQLRPEVSVSEPVAFQQQLSTKSARELQQFADQINNEIKNFEQIRLPGSGDTRYQSSLRNLYGQVKSKLHEIDPNGLAKADVEYSEFAAKAAPLEKLGNDQQLESFINNFYGKNKELTRQSARELIPESIPQLENMAASKAFEAQGPSGSALGRRAAIGGGLVGAGGALASQGRIIPGILTGAASLVTNPALNKQVIGRGSQWAQYLLDNPEYLKLLQSSGGQLTSPWLNIFNQENNK